MKVQQHLKVVIIPPPPPKLIYTIVAFLFQFSQLMFRNLTPYKQVFTPTS
jgi:hypothetical protein